MEILSKVKIILGVYDAEYEADKLLGLSDFEPSNSDDILLEMLVEDAKSEALNYCNLTEYNTKLDSTVVKMVIQNYNKARIQGIASESFSGVSESYVNGYTSDVITMLNKNRRMRFL